MSGGNDLRESDPARFAPANRRRLSGAALRTFLNLAAERRLSCDEQLSILGFPAPSTYRGWSQRARAGMPLTLSVDTLMRISMVLGIYAGLRFLCASPDEAIAWLRGGRSDPPFGGCSPIDLMTEGSQERLLTVRRHLDALCADQTTLM